jgi:hypothetical protein
VPTGAHAAAQRVTRTNKTAEDVAAGHDQKNAVPIRHLVAIFIQGFNEFNHEWLVAVVSALLCLEQLEARIVVSNGDSRLNI